MDLNFTCREVDMALPAIDVEAPEGGRAEIDEEASDVAAQPALEGARDPGSQAMGQQRTQN